MSTDIDELTAAITSVEGVVALHPADPWRAARLDQPPAPAVGVRGDEVRIAVRVAVSAAAGAQTTAIGVLEAARAWAQHRHPALTPQVTVRVVTVEPDPA